MKTKTITLYSFDELSDEAKEKAINKLSDINVDYEWWDCTFDDAKRIGLKILEFDIDRGSYCECKVLTSHREIAEAILKEHGKMCETYKTAEAFLKERDGIIDSAQKNEDGEFEDEYELDQKLDECEYEFLKSISEDYRIILQKEYEYLTSKEAIIETIKANEYDFDEEGNLV